MNNDPHNGKYWVSHLCFVRAKWFDSIRFGCCSSYRSVLFSLCIFLLLFPLQAASSADCFQTARAFPPSPLGPLLPFAQPNQPHRFRPDFPQPPIQPRTLLGCRRAAVKNLRRRSRSFSSSRLCVAFCLPRCHCLFSEFSPQSSVSFFPQSPVDRQRRRRGHNLQDARLRPVRLHASPVSGRNLRGRS